MSVACLVSLLHVVRKPVPCVEEGYTRGGLLLETFRFEDEYDINYEYKIRLKPFLVFLKKNRHLGKLHFTFFNRKVDTLIFI